MTRLRVLLIDDEMAFVRALQQTLIEQQIIVDVAFNGTDGLAMAIDGSYDLLIVDVMLPHISGLEIVSTLRENGDSTPLLLLTARDGLEDRVAGLDSGADDYLVKPFATSELLARIRALTRRVGVLGGTNTIQVGDFCLDFMSRTVSYRGVQMALSTKEFHLMELFMRNVGQVLPKVLILDRVWGSDTTVDFNAVEIYIHFLRKKIHEYLKPEGDVTSPVIETVRGVGYVFRRI